MDNICKEYRKCEDISIYTNIGWVPVDYVLKTIPFEKYIVLFESGREIECADRHAFINEEYKTIITKDLKIGDRILSDDGVDIVFDIFNTGEYEEMYDVSLRDHHLYYANGLLSHNSAFLANMAARQVLNGWNVVLASLEMSEDAFAQRFDAIFSMYDINKLYKDSQVRKKLPSALDKVKGTSGRGNLWIKQYPTGKATVEDFRKYIRELTMRGLNPQIFICDYMNLMKPAYKSKGDMYNDVKTISEELRAMSFEFKMPIISVSQLNREGMNIPFEQVDFTYISECLSLDTSVLKWDGKIYIAEKISNLKKDDIIMGSKDNVCVKRLFNKKIKKMYKIKTKGGKEIICSADHKFPTSEGIKNINSGLCVGEKLKTL